MISIKCETGYKAKLEDLLPLQGKLKNLTESNFRKLKQQLMDEGFIAPFFVWQKDDEMFLLDGHQRHFVLRSMRDEGIKLPEYFPIVPVLADNYKQACKRVLAISSQYGTISKDGLKEFVKNSEIEKEELIEAFTFDAIEFDKWEDDYNPEPGSLDDQQKLDERKEKNFVCPSCSNVTNLREYGF